MGETVVTKWYGSETTQSEHEMVKLMQLHIVVVKRYSGIVLLFSHRRQSTKSVFDLVPH